MIPPPRLMVPAPVTVVETTSEDALDAPPEIPWRLRPDPGAIAVQLRSTLRRVSMGAGLARREDLLARTRAIGGLPPLVISPAGGTFVIGGTAWMGICAIGVPYPGQSTPLDWMMASLLQWFAAALHPLGLGCSIGRVAGAWCPGFSDVAVGGRKLAGLGFRVTRDWVVMRGMLAVGRLDGADLAVLQAVHRLIGIEVVRDAVTSLTELTGDASWTVEGAMTRFAEVVTAGG